MLALPALGCAKGEEIGPTEIVIFQLAPDGGAGAPGTGGSANMPEGSSAASPGSPASPAQTPIAPGDAGAVDAGRSEDRPADAGD